MKQLMDFDIFKLCFEVLLHVISAHTMACMRKNFSYNFFNVVVTILNHHEIINMANCSMQFF